MSRLNRVVPLVLAGSIVLAGCDQEAADTNAEEMAEQAQRFEKQAEERAAEFEQRLAARAEESGDGDEEDEPQNSPDR